MQHIKDYTAKAFNKCKEISSNAANKIEQCLDEYNKEVDEKKMKYQHQRMIDALTGHSIYSQDFYNFLRKGGYGFYFEFCQDVHKLHQHFNLQLCKEIEDKYEMEEFEPECEQKEDKYDKYRYDDVLQQILTSSTLKNNWLDFESKIYETKPYKMHDYQTHIGSLNLNLIGAYGLKSEIGYLCNPKIKLGLGNQMYETDVKYGAESVEYGQCYTFDICNIKKEFLYIQVIDHKVYGKLSVLDYIKIDLSNITNPNDTDLIRAIKLKNGAVINVKIDLQMIEPFYYRNN